MFSKLLELFAGLWMGFGLGANDAANLFGPGVAAKTVKYRTATILIAVFVILGAVTEGSKCMGTLGSLGDVSTLNEAIVILAGAAMSVMLMTILGVPVSTSQAVVGSILGSVAYKNVIGISENFVQSLKSLTKIVLCWVGTPIGAALIGFILFFVVEKIVDKYIKNLIALNSFIKWSLIISGCYGAYGLGANNVANATAVYVNAGFLTEQQAALYGGLAIAFGALTFSKGVMMTVGQKIAVVGPMGALIATFAHSIIIHFYTQVGVPVSSSQAIVGAVMGIGLVKGIKNVSFKKIFHIMIGWVLTPVGAGIFTFLLIKSVVFFKVVIY